MLRQNIGFLIQDVYTWMAYSQKKNIHSFLLIQSCAIKTFYTPIKDVITHGRQRSCPEHT